MGRSWRSRKGERIRGIKMKGRRRERVWGEGEVW